MVLAVLDGEPITPAAAPARLPQQRGGARRGDRASVERNGRRWTAACGRAARFVARDAAPRRRRWIAALVTRAVGCDAPRRLRVRATRSRVC